MIPSCWRSPVRTTTNPMHDSDTIDSSNPAATGGSDSLPAGNIVHTASSSNGAATTIADDGGDEA
jgi:hypothetical protein